MGRTVRSSIVVLAALIAFASCTMKDSKRPPLSGPSELGLSLALSAVPDVLTQDGAAQSQVVVFARDANAQPVRNLPVRAEITVRSYRVVYKRADGRNTPGVDVPYPFDGAATGTFTANAQPLDFVLVRAQAKQEAPLAALRGNGGAQIISVIAEVTFYGRDQAGNDVSVVGEMSINFADWGDPQQ